MELQTQDAPPKESPQVKAFDEKLNPLKQRRNALDARVSELLTALNPNSPLPTQTERTVVEARLALPQVKADLQRVDLDIADLEGARAKVLNAEQQRAKEELNRQIGEEVKQLRRDFEQYIRPRNRKIHELEELKEKLTGKQVFERWAWWDLFDPTPTSETRWDSWTRSITEYFGV